MTMDKLKEFMLLFRFEPTQAEPAQEQENEMHKQWGAFIGGVAAQGKLVSTHQLGFEGRQIGAGQTVDEGIHIAEKQTTGGNMVLMAASMDEAVDLAKKCPILSMGGTVEVRDIVPMN